MKRTDFWEADFPRWFKCKECKEYFYIPAGFEPEVGPKGWTCDKCYKEYILKEGEKKMGKFKFYFTKDNVGYLWDEISKSQVKEYLDRGWFVETIRADHRWQAYKIVEEWNCELAHTLTGEHCTCGGHDF